MRMSRVTFVGLLALVIISIVITRVLNVISVSYNFEDYQDEGTPVPAWDPSIVIGASSAHLMWFLQISDIHLSIFNDPDRIAQFQEFCNTTVEAIKPEVVLASGDLADAKTNDMVGSRQYLQEWKYYGETLINTKIPDRTLWLDIRGNHDNFNVPGVNSTTSYYHKYSIQGQRHLRSYMYTIQKGSENYSFIAVDACLEPGQRRPFNFIGTLADDQYRLLQKFEADSRSSNATIWFGHYPSSCIISPKPGLRNLMKSGVAYLCGHLHTLAGTVPNMYTLQHSGTLELELGDWKDNRLFRLAAFDHGLFSFVDISHGHWPLILVTNPKSSEFGLPHKEPLSYIANSTHIRVLVFSLAPIEIVQVKLGDDTEWTPCKNVKGPLFVSEWNPKVYLSGMHQIRVKATDKEGRSSESSQSFSLDGTRKKFNLLPRLTLMSDATSIFYEVFIILVAASVLPLLFLKTIHFLVKGPWFIGEVIDNHIGAAFAWGTYVKGTILPGAFSYFYGCIQLFWFHIPFVLVVAHCVDFRFRTLCHPDSRNCSIRTSAMMNNLPCFIVLCSQAMFAYYFWLAYGTMALLLGPLRTWSVVMGAYLWYCACTLKADHLIEARIIWGNKDYYHFIGENKETSRHAL